MNCVKSLKHLQTKFLWFPKNMGLCLANMGIVWLCTFYCVMREIWGVRRHYNIHGAVVKWRGGGGGKVCHITKNSQTFPRTKSPFPTVPNKFNYWHTSGKTRNYEIVSVLGNVWLCEVEMVSCQVFGGWVNILWPFAHNLLMPQPRKPTMKRMRHYYYSPPFFCFLRLSSY